MQIIKRDGTEVEFDGRKIFNAISKEKKKMSESDKLTDEEMGKITSNVIARCDRQTSIVSVEDVQDFVETELINSRLPRIAKEYITYRFNRQLARRSDTMSDNIMTLLENKNQVLKEENSNKNTLINSVQRDYMAGEVSKMITETRLLPSDIEEADKIGDIHFHDKDYFAQPMYNCCLINLQDMLENSTVISGTGIDTPHTFSTACNISTQIIAQVASNQYGGQTISLAHLAPFVERSRVWIWKQMEIEFASAGVFLSAEQKEAILKIRLQKELEKGVQTLQYQVITLMTTNGQAPFLSLSMYLNEARNEHEKEDLALIIEVVLKQRIQGVKNEQGVWVTPAFPKLIYVLDDNNCDESKPYWYLTELAAQCTARRMVPDYVSEKIMKQNKIDANGNGQCFPPMGCRSFLSPYVDELGIPKYFGRFNQGVVTINLPAVGLTARGDFDKFWSLLDEKLEICHRALRLRHERLLGTPSDVAPILWQHGAIARLDKGEKIDKLLFGGYSTISLGYAGLCECVKAMMGVSHTTPEGKEFALQIMQKLNDKCNEWKKAENIGYAVYGTPLESTTYKFAKALQKRFGIIPGITDKNYITNSYHVHVTEKIDAFSKLKFESEFQKLSSGGAISYVEVPDMTNNIPAVLELIKFIYQNIQYAELNTKSDYCLACGYDGEIAIVEEDGKLLWECPNCKNRDQTRMSVARRTCGYIGTQFWNQGRTQEIRDRVQHL